MDTGRAANWPLKVLNAHQDQESAWIKIKNNHTESLFSVNTDIHFIVLPLIIVLGVMVVVVANYF